MIVMILVVSSVDFTYLGVAMSVDFSLTFLVYSSSLMVISVLYRIL